MESFGGFGFSDQSSSARKRRSTLIRRPRNDSQPFRDHHDIPSLASTPPPENDIVKNDNLGSGESDEASINGSFEGSNEERYSRVDSNRSSSRLLASAKWKDMSKAVGHGVASDVLENENNKVKKVKLKVGNVTRTIHTNSTSEGASGVGSTSSNSSRVSDASQTQQKLPLQDTSDDNYSFALDKKSGLQSYPWKDSFKSGFMSSDGLSVKKTDNVVPAYKSKRVLKRRISSGELDDENGPLDKIQYLDEPKSPKANYYSENYDNDEEGASRKHRKLSGVLRRDSGGQHNKNLGNYGSSKMGKVGKKSRLGRGSEDTDYVEEEEPVSDDEPGAIRKKARKEIVDSVEDSKMELTVTTRRRALQLGKDVSSGLGAVQIEFPHGLPPAPPKKQKEKLTEVEQQLKKAEAAQRRRMQVEKAARESQAEAIRKILGQDSSRKKREDKMKKRQEELAQEKATNSMVLPSHHVRWVMGPSGTVVTFPNEIGLPNIFSSRPCSYPPPREKCAGPSCRNPYKYRDAKTKLPLCSLQCYKAIQEQQGAVPAC